MAEALLGLEPSSYGHAPGNQPAIANPDDLAVQLRRELDTKKTPTRCEHISVTLDLPSTAEFPICEGDGDAHEYSGPAALDDAGNNHSTGGQPARMVRAYETIINQPHDNPVTQRAVAKYITSLLSSVDESTWVVREVSRGHYGWAFTYNCADSFATWNRQNGKTASKSLIGEYSQKELDPVISGRPAFDCRGTLTIAFSKNSRTINVKYGHTPLHKSVAEMIEHFRPLPPAAPREPLIPPGGKPKKTPRRRKSEVNHDGPPSQSKRKRKSEQNIDGTPSQPNKKRKQVSEAGAGGATSADEEATASAPTKADTAVQSDIHSHAVLNVPPAEAARRREVAIRLLSDSGVDAESLSTEQFSIFANQSPDLQKESLTMLMKYGAERLRIVHPNDAAASSTTIPQQPTAQLGAGVNTLAAASESPTPGKRKRSRKSNLADSDAELELTPAPAGTPLRQISRGSCIACRKSRLKCNRAKPTCDNCEQEQVECQYPLVKRQAPKMNQDKPVVEVDNADDDDDKAESEPESDPEPETEPAAEPETESEEQEPDDIDTIDYSSNMPVSHMLTAAAEVSHPDYFNSGPSELAYAQNHSNNLSIAYSVAAYPDPSAVVTYTEQQLTTNGDTQPSSTEPASDAQQSIETAHYTQPTVNENLSYSQPAATENVAYSEPSVKSPKATRTAAASTTRRGLPSGPGQQQQQQQQQPITESPDPLPGYVSHWQTMSPSKASRAPQSTMSTTAYSDTPSLNNVAHYNTYGTKYTSDSGNQVTTRIAYEPYSAQTRSVNTSTYPSYDSYDRSSAASQSASLAYNPSNDSRSGQWSSTRARNARSYSNTPQAATSHTELSSTVQQQSASLQSFNMRASATSSQSTPSPAAYNKQQQQQQQQPSQAQSQQTQSYASFSQAHEQSAQSDQHSWYGFGSNSNTPFPQNNVSGEYAAKGSAPANYGSSSGNANQTYQQQQHHGSLNIPGHNYAGGDSDLYDLIKNSLQSSGR
ncbi:hypothetical protein CCHL11_01052 [Colletotrichum chlorophyti]|uniref:Zn(2)-C6 fungal-type domain-containing protein n=1 Tax=Colletotrichum chlorophyti TaxID=708187 RepID=A0A1Q8S7I1_9PEZI|nr:hypothetical protein CCHL11_01052 [Colletotrichum chlorophyti]